MSFESMAEGQVGVDGVDKWRKTVPHVGTAVRELSSKLGPSSQYYYWLDDKVLQQSSNSHIFCLEGFRGTKRSPRKIKAKTCKCSKWFCWLHESDQICCR